MKHLFLHQQGAKVVRLTSLFGFLLVAYLFLFLSNVYAQNNSNKSFEIRDLNSHSTISDVVFRYGDQKGIIKSDGILTIELNNQDWLHLTHISYGQYHFSPEELIRLSSIGVIYLTHRTELLSPVTVMAIREDQTGETRLRPNQHDKLSHDAGTLLNQLPEISGIRKSGSYGMDPVMRGFKYDQLQVVVDGVMTASAACPNRMDPPTSQVPINMMEQVEIMKGPYALRYGNGIGGTINFSSKSPEFDDTSRWDGRLSISSESNGGLFRTESMISNSGKWYESSAFLSWSRGGDYEDGSGAKVSSGFDRVSYGLRTALKLTDLQNLRFSVNRNVAKDTEFASLAMDLISDETTMVQGEHHAFIDGKNLRYWTSAIYYSYVDHFMSNELKPLNPRMVNSGTSAETNNFGGRSEGTWLFGDTKWYTGLDFRREAAKGTRSREMLMGPMTGMIFYDNAWQNGFIQKYAFFAEMERQFNLSKFSFSTRFGVEQADINDPDLKFEQQYNDLGNSELLFGINTGYMIKHNQNVETGIWLGRVSRGGSLTERYINYFPVGVDPYEMLGNPAIKAETNNQIDVIGSLSLKNTKIDLNLFYSYVEDFITGEVAAGLVPRMSTSPGVRRYVNIEAAELYGGEFSVTFNAFDFTDHSFRVAYTVGHNLELDEPLAEIAPLDFRYRFGMDILNTSIRPELTIRHVLEQDRISPTFGEKSTDAFTKVDLRFSGNIYQNLRLIFGVDNLLDVTYSEHLNRAVSGSMIPIYAPGRNFYLTLTTTL